MKPFRRRKAANPEAHYWQQKAEAWKDSAEQAEADRDKAVAEREELRGTAFDVTDKITARAENAERERDEARTKLAEAVDHEAIAALRLQRLTEAADRIKQLQDQIAALTADHDLLLSVHTPAAMAVVGVRVYAQELCDTRSTIKAHVGRRVLEILDGGQ